MTFPLSSVRVLDLGQYIAGPCAAVLLAEMGADVVKIEPPGRGDAFRQWETEALNATFVAFNRGKRSVELDLKDEASRPHLEALVRSADVLVENFRPGVMDRLGLSYDEVRDLNPRLVYCSLNGFGSSGPYASMPAYDSVALGFSGLAGLLMDPEEPRMRGPALADAVTGHSAAFSILAALLDRERSGAGCHLEVSMFGALVHFLQSAVAKKVVDDQEEGPETRSRLSQAYAFVARDGKALLIHMSSPPKFWEGLCRAVQRPDLLEDERFADRPARIANYHELREELAGLFRTRDRDDWLETLRAHEVPCAPVNSIGEALADEQLRHLGIVEAVDDAVAGRMPVMRPPVHIDGRLVPAVPRAPFLGEHTEDILGALDGAPGGPAPTGGG